jgi:hypothetical protein
MSKKISIFLVILFIVHVLITISINITSIAFLKDKSKVKINSFGKLYLDKVWNFEFPEIVKFYSNYAGISHGYTFYSPNLPDIKINYVFYSKNKPIKNVVMMSESRIKFQTLLDNIIIYKSNIKVRENIFKSIYRNVLRRNNNLNEIDVNMVVKKIKPLDTYELGGIRDSIFKINAYNIKSVVND